VLQICFKGLTPADFFHCQPIDECRLGGQALSGPAGGVIAVFRRGFWCAGQRFYTRITFSGPVVVELLSDGDDQRQACGVFPCVDIRGMMLIGGDHYLAALLESGLWRCERTQTQWDSVRIAFSAPVPQSAALTESATADRPETPAVTVTC
jgi:hypothetical protein